jgi:putative acetyltransferase
MGRREVDLRADITIRPFTDDDAPQVRELFIVVNRLLSPAVLRDAFEAYIERALAEEIDRITAYYGERDGGFWMAIQNDMLVGTFGLERASPDAMELRRMYVDPGARRRGIARQMLCRTLCRVVRRRPLQFRKQFPRGQDGHRLRNAVERIQAHHRRMLADKETRPL